MLTKFKDKISKINKAAGLEITLLPEGAYNLTLTTLALNKGTIAVEKKENIKNRKIESILDLIEKEIPVFLVMNGRGVLHKKIAESSSDNNYLIQSVLPNAKAQDFYIQNIPSEKSSLVSIIRKEIADPVLKTIQDAGFYCIGFSLGGGIVSSVLPLLSADSKEQLKKWSEHNLEIGASGTISDYKFQNNSEEKIFFQLDTERIEDYSLVSYSAAFSVLTDNLLITPFVESTVLNKEEFLNKQLFKKMGMGALVFFFVVLMLNFIFFFSFSSKNNELSLKENKFSHMFSEMENLGKQVNDKQGFLSEAGWLQSSSMTYYADRIASTVPPSVKLTELSINPVDERKSREEKKELFNAGIISIKGNCTRPTELNEWLDKIKAIDKITKARLVHYTYDHKDSKGEFSIEIETEN